MVSKIAVLLEEPIAAISPNLYGHFIEHLGSCIYDGLWVGEESSIPNIHGIRTDTINALRKLNPPLIRWPGGSFADDYHWQDGIGTPEARPRRVNIWWGNGVEPNAFGTHEFIRLCRAIGAAPYICGNVGTGTPRELRDWIEYCNYPRGTTLSDLRMQNGAAEPFNVSYWAVGNESWHSGGSFNPEEYAMQYARFSTFAREFGYERDKLYLIACGPSGNDLDWTERFFTRLRDRIAPITLHAFAGHYYIGRAGTATDYSDDQWYYLLWQTGEIENLILQQRALMDRFDPQRKVHFVVDEWGTWHQPEPGEDVPLNWQQNTLRDGLFAGLVLNIFNRLADKVTLANIAQAVNVLGSMLLTQEERMIVTPMYHVFDLYQTHQGAQAIRILVDSPTIAFTHKDSTESLPALSGSASYKNGVLTLTVVNLHIEQPVEAEISLDTGQIELVRETLLTADDIHAHNTFDMPNRVALSAIRELPATGRTIRYTFMAKSVTRLDVTLS